MIHGIEIKLKWFKPIIMMNMAIFMNRRLRYCMISNLDQTNISQLITIN